ncbi:unnamed protein product [Symbiodinium natans]|uniref:Uncharacterized protein n=1 Tax=Symbiodinium natans TaxID=878477 RepID=A0A812R1D8_9DINO|nr:unnamed protein product [Symbiodinium natans]
MKRYAFYLAICCAFAPQSVAERYYSKLQDLRSSAGTWDHDFASNDTSYQVFLEKFVADLTFEADINFGRYLSPDFYPVITVGGEAVAYKAGKPAVHTLQLGGTPSELLVRTILVEVAPPEAFGTGSQDDRTVYKVIVTRQADFSAALLPARLEIEDDLYNVVLLRPAFEAMAKNILYEGLVSSGAKRLRLQFACSPPAAAIAQVGAKQLESGGDNVDAWVDADPSGQTDFTVACTWKGERHSVEVSVEEMVDLGKVNIDLETIGGLGTPKQLPDGSGWSVVAGEDKVRLVAIFKEEGLKLDFEEEPGGRQYALGAGVPSPTIEVPVNSTKEVYLLLHSAQEERRLIVKLSRAGQTQEPGKPAATKSSSSEVSAAAVLAGHAMTAFAAVASMASAASALSGDPSDAAPLLRLVLLPLQLLALSEPSSFNWEVPRHKLLGDLAHSLRGTCLQAPWMIPPWTWREPPDESLSGAPRMLREGAPEARAAAASTLTVGSLAMALLVVLHLCILAGRLALPVDCHCRRYTVPHRLKLGAWEAHASLLLAFPLAWACCLLLWHRQDDVDYVPEALTTELHKVANVADLLPTWATFVLTGLLLLGILAFCRVSRVVFREDVVWLLEEAVRPNSRQQESGRYCDLLCDQLTCRPVETAWDCCASWMPLRSSSTVADVAEVSLVPARSWFGGGSRKGLLKVDIVDEDDAETEQLLSGPRTRDSGQSDKDATSQQRPSLLKAAYAGDDSWAEVDPDMEISVEVLSTVQPGCFWRRRETEEVGFFSGLSWLQALFGPKTLAHFHHEMQLLLDDWSTPLRVKASQLQGPLTNSWLAFCFDGQRWPLWPCLELLQRVCLGVSCAFALHPEHRTGALMASSGLCCTMFAAGLLLSPCSSHLGNLALLLCYLACSILCLTQLGHTLGWMATDEATVAALLAAVLVLILCAVATLRLLALLVAMCCPRIQELDETCNVDLGLLGPGAEWLLQLPAVCRVPVSDSFVIAPADQNQVREALAGEIVVTQNLLETTRPKLEFQALDYVAKVSPLEPPQAVLLGPGGRGHRHFSEIVYEDEDAGKLCRELTARCFGREISEPIAHQVLQLLRQRARPGEILVVVLAAAVLPAPVEETSSSSEGEPGSERYPDEIQEEHEGEALLRPSMPHM